MSPRHQPHLRCARRRKAAPPLRRMSKSVPLPWACTEYAGYHCHRLPLQGTPPGATRLAWSADQLLETGNPNLCTRLIRNVSDFLTQGLACVRPEPNKEADGAHGWQSRATSCKLTRSSGQSDARRTPPVSVSEVTEKAKTSHFSQVHRPPSSTVYPRP